MLSNKIMKAIAAVILVLVVFLSCRKDSFISSKDAALSFSTDTVRFDTVFTNVGSITQSFKIRNENNQRLLISNIILKGGSASAFRMNVDGIQSYTVNNVEIEANDSIYVFVSATVSSGTGIIPFVVQDSIEVNYNGNTRYVQLESWGQNANFLRERVIRGHETWNSRLPYVILGGLIVDSNATLTIEKGVRVYMHANAPIIVDGTLEIQGIAADSSRVYFQSDRLDPPYNGFPGSWPGIYFRGSSSRNFLNYAVIRNAYQGIVAEQLPLTTAPKITLNQCIISNIYDAGILAVQTSIQANNCLIVNCGKNIQLLFGGNYVFDHCTIASYSSSYILHKDPLLAMSNNTGQTSSAMYADFSAIFRNSIFWSDGGAVETEMPVSKLGTNSFNLQFTNCLIKDKTDPQNAVTSNMIRNQDPQFDSINASRQYYDFHLKTSSPALNTGLAGPLRVDLDGLPRPVGRPDPGAYEKQ